MIIGALLASQAIFCIFHLKEYSVEERAHSMLVINSTDG